MSQSLHPALNRPSPLAYRRTVRRQFEGVLKTILFLCSVVAVLTTVGIEELSEEESTALLEEVRRDARARGVETHVVPIPPRCWAVLRAAIAAEASTRQTRTARKRKAS